MSAADIFWQLLRGAPYTLLVTSVCAATGLCIGLFVAALRRARIPGLQVLIAVYAYVFRGVPVLVLLFLAYFGLPSIGIKLSPLLAMALSLGLTAGAYLAEVFRGALASIDTTEIVAAEAMGFSRLQIMRLVEFPQMLRFAVPGMINEFTTILKYSPFAYTVGIPEITKQATALTARTLQGIEIYLCVGLLYFAIYRVVLSIIRSLASRYQVPGFGTA